MASRKMKPKKTAEKEKAPESLFQLLILLVKGFIKNIPKTLIKIGIIALLVFLLHTYLVIYPNGGFSSMGTKLSDMLSLKQSKNTGTILWTIMSTSLLSSFTLMRTRGIPNFFKGILLLPPRLITSFSKRNGILMSLLCGVTYLLSYYLIKNAMLTLVLAIALLLSVAAFRASFTYVIMRLGHSDFYRLIRQKGHVFNEQSHMVLLFSISIGLLLYTLLPKSFFSVAIVVLLLVAFLVLNFTKKNNRTKAVGFFLITGLYTLSSNLILGDDGGVREAGGLINWIGSPGAFTAVTLGLPPAIGSALGGIIAITLGENGMANIFTEFSDTISDAVNETVEDLGELVDDMTNPEIMTDTINGTVDDMSEMAGDAIDFIAESADVAEDTIKHTVSDMDDMIDDTSDAISDGIDILSETWSATSADLTDIYEGLTDPAIMNETIANTYGDLADIASDIYENPDILWDTLTTSSADITGIIQGLQDNLLTSDSIDWIADNFDALVPDWVVKAAADSAGEAWDLIGNIKGLGDLAGVIPDGNPLADFLGNAGIVKDALENFGKGDNPIYATIKSWASNAVKGAATSMTLADGTTAMSPTGVMELVSNIFLNGTGADTIVNPGKTIQGTANFIMDSVADLLNGTNDTASRLEAGDYGGFYQTMNQAFAETADAVYNTSDFVQRLEENYTIGEFFDDMRTNNTNLWKVKEDSFMTRAFDQLASQPGSIFQVINNRNASLLGEKAFEAITYVGEGWTYIGKGWKDLITEAAHAPEYADMIADGVSDYASSASDAVSGYATSATQWIKSLW